MSIKILAPDVAAKIAAGEVIERPASVLKELLENSADAGASSVRIEIEKAGKTLIRVADDGAGMGLEDIRGSVLRHATSKISEFSDLDSLSTFGFRGEALYSVSAVSRMSITSCERGASAGWSVSFDAGKETDARQSAPAPGTAVEVRDLFHNTPARFKFLKSDQNERGHLIRAVEEFAFANPAVAVSLKIDGSLIYAFPARRDFNEGVLERAHVIFGKEAAGGLLKVSLPEAGFFAVFSSPDKMQSGRQAQYYFVNRRPVASKTMQQALYKAYGPARQYDRFPAAVLCLTLPPADFDVNIHPQKRDVRFKSEGMVFGLVMNAAARAIAGRAEEERGLYARQDAALSHQQIAETVPPLPAEFSLPVQPVQQEMAYGEIHDAAVSAMESSPAEPAASLVADVPAPSVSRAPSWYRPPYRYIGAIENSYLVFENAGGLFLMDQHAAQERVFYEKYLSEMRAGHAAVQPLAVPLVIELPASDAEAVLAWGEWLSSAGFEIERFGPGTVQLRSIPVLFRFSEDEARKFIVSLSGMLGDPQKAAEDVKRNTLATLACKRAVKAYDRLNEESAMRLLKDLSLCENGTSCPHGRPVFIQFTAQQLASKFGRTTAL